MQNTIFPAKLFIKQLYFIALPIALQNISISTLAIIDIAVINHLGEGVLSAISLANQLAFVTNLITFGLCSGASVFLSRYYGMKSTKDVQEVFAVTLFVTLLLNSIVTLFGLFFPGKIMSIFTDKSELIQLGKQYLIICAPSYLFMAMSYSFTALFRSAAKPHYTLVPTIVSLALKTILNYILIYGVGYIPPFGIRGVAISTLISRIVEFSLNLYIYFKFFDSDYRLTAKHLLKIDFKTCVSFLKNTRHIILNESFWGIGIALFSVIFGRMEVSSITAFNITKTLEEIFNSFFYGIGIGAVVILGQNIGRKEYEIAKTNAKRFAIAGAGIGTIIMIIMFAIRGWFVDTFFTVLTPETKELTKLLIAISAISMVFRSLSSVLLMGVMRAGGDSKRAMYYDVFPIYMFSLPLGFVLGIWLKLPIYIVLPVIYGKRIIKAVLALSRLRNDRWLLKYVDDNVQRKPSSAFES